MKLPGGWRHLCLRGLVVMATACALMGQKPVTDDPNEIAPKAGYDAFLESSARRELNASEAAALRAAAKGGTEVQLEKRLGLPTFLWAAQPGKEMRAGVSKDGKRNEETAARGHLSRLGESYRLKKEDIDAAALVSIHNTGKGAVIVKFRQTAGGVEVFREEVSVMMNQNLQLVAISGFLAGAGGSPVFALGPQEAVARALGDLVDSAVAAGELQAEGEAAGGYGLYRMTPDSSATRNLDTIDPARVKRTMFRMPDRLEAAYYVELSVQQRGSGNVLTYSYVISASDGRMLFRNNLTAEEKPAEPTPFSYRAWAETTGAKIPHDGPQGTAPSPHPTGLPDGYQAPFILPELITLGSGPISTLDPWLPGGATETNGNNVDAYADLVSPDGFTAASADTRAHANGLNTFDRVYDTALAPNASSDQIQAAVTQLFYTTNFLHDWFYDAGFDEASGNAQANNYGRGGVENDSMRAEAQDYSGTNNANMSTPSDGGRPRMQMYVWTGNARRALTVNSPSAIAGTYPVGTAAFGPQAFNVTANVVLVNDGVGATSDGCQTPFVNAADVAGKIALIDRGICSFAIKSKNAQLNGAIGVLIANNDAVNPDAFINMGGVDPTITIGTLSVSLNRGNAVKAQLVNGVNATLLREAVVNRDGTIDNQIVAHEWGHYISNRLVGNSGGLTNNQGRGMGEGWGDFHAMLMTVRQEDAQTAAGANFAGVYSVAGYSLGGGANGPDANNSYYFGIRRYPYSTDFTKNALTFKHISNGVALPAGVPVQPNGNANAQVHNTGEIWASMLWECYASLLRQTLQPPRRMKFEEARDRMREYLVAAYKMTPNAPTLVEARDALLAAAYANDRKDFVEFWNAFARRGLGTGAVAPDRSSTTNSPLAESFVAGGALSFGGASLSDDQISCDRDGMLDNGETGRMFITLRNEGAKLLSNTVATVTSTNPNVSFPDGNKVSFSATQPFGESTKAIRVKLSGAVGIQTLTFEISYNDPDLNPIGPFTATFSTTGNADVLLNASASDSFDAPVTSWTTQAAQGTVLWSRVELSPGNLAWNGPDSGFQTDTFLISPDLNVGADPFSLSFVHRFQLEATWDGGVVEISTDGGTTWTKLNAGYNGTLLPAPNNTNPLQGQTAFTGASGGYPSFVPVTINLGNAYAGQTVKVRFRVGTDSNTGASGWDIDNLVVTGITNTPFHQFTAELDSCKK